jgi:hypothetical protein
MNSRIPYRHIYPLPLKSNFLQMNSNNNSHVFATVIAGLGISAEERPSIYSPIAVNLLYSNNPDGSVRFIWSKGDWMKKLHRLLFSLGWQKALPGGLVLYTDVPTATFLRMQCQQNKTISLR